ncbi:MAG: branched-chain amino acid ABC transporter permease, partial [Armatimonadota bacterium]|nr:branched-chain amino acid ABC transporter permease [Armatimonadota bacterium]
MSPLAQALQFAISGLINGSIYAIVALGFTIIYNATGIINFAQGEFVMLGAMLMVTLTTAVALPAPVAFPIAVAGVVVIGCVVERLAIRPVRERSIIPLVTITIGASIVLRGAALLVWGTDYRALKPFSDSPPFFLGEAMLLPQGVWVLAVTIVVVVLLQIFYQCTLVGKAMRASAINRNASRLVGVAADRMVLGAFALSAGLGAVAGVIIAPISGAAFDMGVMLGLKGFAAAILGGLGSSAGGILGGVALGLLESLGAGYVSSAYKDALAFSILLLVLLVRPAGRLGRLRN